MARCTCTGQPPGAASTAAGTGLEASATAAVSGSETAVPQAPPNPFEGWTKPPAPSDINRRAVSREDWGAINSQKTHAKGVTDFSCGGHGGLFAVVGVADLRPEWVDAARAEGLVQTYAAVAGRRGFDFKGPSTHYKPGQLEDWRQANADRGLDTATVEVLVCEEDCAFSVGVLAMADKPRAKVIGTVQKYFSAMSDEYLEGRVKEYYPDVWERVTGEKVTAAESGTVRRREWYAAHADDHVGVSAVGSWADGVPAGKVKVTTRIGGHGADYRNDGDEAEWLVDSDRYDQRHPEGYVVDPAVDQQVTARAA